MPNGQVVIVDGYEISGGESLQARQVTIISAKLMLRNIKWIKSSITAHEREKYYGQQAKLLVITGKTETDKKASPALEKAA